MRDLGPFVRKGFIMKFARTLPIEFIRCVGYD
jgi:hypothetical protein